MIIYGTRMFGRVDTVPGVCYVATRFFHIWFIPLIPLSSMLVLDDSTPDSTMGLSIPMSGKSVLAAYFRALSMVAGLVMIGFAIYTAITFADSGFYETDYDAPIGYSATGGYGGYGQPGSGYGGYGDSEGYGGLGGYPQPEYRRVFRTGDLVAMVGLFFGAAVAFLSFWLSYRLTRASQERTTQLLGDLGLSQPAPAFGFGQPAAPAPSSWGAAPLPGQPYPPPPSGRR